MICTRQPDTQNQKSQRGLIGILLLVTIAVVAVAIFNKNLWGEDAKNYEQKVNREALQQAKEALLDYLVVADIASENDSNNPFSGANTLGRLPCPDQLGKGTSETNCGIGTASTYRAPGYHSLGLFPWETVNSPVLRDAARQCLWYAVDGLYKATRPTTPVNSDSYGSFSVVQPVKPTNPAQLSSTWPTQLLVGDQTTGASSSSRVVAVIIAPGSASGSKTKASIAEATNPCGLTRLVKNQPNAEASAPDFLKYYSASFNNQSLIPASGTPSKNLPNPADTPADALTTFITADRHQEQLKNHIIWITVDEVANAMTRRIAQLYANRINLYVSQTGFYPWAASTPGGPCIKYLLQGFVPYDCDVYPVDSTYMSTPSQSLAFGNHSQGFYSDADAWAGQAHYAVATDCVATSSISITTPGSGGRRPTAPTTVIYPLLGSGGTKAHPCLKGPDRIDVGTGPNGPAAIILMRGRKLATQRECVLYDPAKKAETSNVSFCLEDATNQATVGRAFKYPKFYIPPPSPPFRMYGNASYRVPQTSSSNDYMVQLTAN